MSKLSVKISLLLVILLVSGHYQIAYAQDIPQTDLTVGSHGSDVVLLQKFLIAHNYLTMPVGVDLGYFGTITKIALRAYQENIGIKPSSGYFGAITRKKMSEATITNGTDFVWVNASYASAYQTATWNSIDVGILDGLTAQGISTVREKIKRCQFSDEDCRDEARSERRLQLYEGLGPLSYKIITFKQNRHTKTADSYDDLISYFAPVENESEAVSFVGVTQKSLEVDSNTNKLVGRVSDIGDEYLVELTSFNRSGCAPDVPVIKVFRVSYDGDIQLVAYRNSKPIDSSTPILCID